MACSKNTQWSPLPFISHGNCKRNPGSFCSLTRRRSPGAVREPYTFKVSLRTRPTMSRSSPNTTRSTGSVGWANQCFIPSRPFSSASVRMNSKVRLGRSPSSTRASANSMRVDVPLALSSAPGCT
jgi:hypothetical protein